MSNDEDGKARDSRAVCCVHNVWKHHRVVVVNLLTTLTNFHTLFF